MKITLSQYAGFCDGVKRAFDIVMGIDVSQAKKPIYILGSLAHNSEVRGKVAEKGIAEISREKFCESRAGEIGTIIITAHGIGPEIYEQANEIGAEIIDTTCPKVIKVQRLAKHFADNDYAVIIIGDADHSEVKGINEWGKNKALFVSRLEDVENLNLSSDEKIAVLSQTTQNEDFCREVSDIIKQKYKNAEINFTTCHATHFRQGEVKKMARENEAVVVIGSKTSANSRRLWEIASSINPQSYFIEKAEELDKKWFRNIEKVAVTAGASTPDWTIREVVEALEKV